MWKAEFLGIALFCGFAILTMAPMARGDEAALRKAVSFYASFDEALAPDVGAGTLSTRFNDDKQAGKFVFENGFDAKVFRIAKGKGVAGGGCLEATDVLPRNGRIFFPAKGNLAYKKEGWGGALSVWINTDPNTLFKTKFCDPIQITHQGANNGGIWFDFNDAKPRDMHGEVFPAVAPGAVGAKEDDADAPMVRVPKIDFKVGQWHHVALSWMRFDTGKKNALASLYIDGKLIGTVQGRAIAMAWDIEKAGIFVAVNYVGLLDELALFGTALTVEDVALLHKNPGLLSTLKKKS